MADYAKSQVEVLSHQSVSLGSIVSGEVDVEGALAGVLQIFHANVGTTANASGADYLVRVSGSGSGDEDWTTLVRYSTSRSAASQANIAGSEAIGQTAIGVGAGEEAGFSSGELVYIQDTGTVGDGEWGIVVDTNTNEVVLLDGLTNAKDSADDIFDQAEQFTLHLDLAGVRRVEVVCNHNRSGTGSTIHTQALLTLAGSIY